MEFGKIFSNGAHKNFTKSKINSRYVGTVSAGGAIIFFVWKEVT